MKRQATERLARAHYQDAWLYDRRYGRRRVDVPYYVALARRSGGPVLELGAGTGRITLPIARSGTRVVAVEREARLCTALRSRLQKEPVFAGARATVVRADFRRLPSLGRFSAILAPFNAFSHCYETAELCRVLRSLRARLVKGGVLAFDVPLPCIETLGYDPDRRYRVGNATGPDGTKYKYYESFEYDPAEQTLLVVAHYVAGRKSFDLPLLHRMHFPRELRFVLEQCGFRVVRHDGGFEGEALDGAADS